MNIIKSLAEKIELENEIFKTLSKAEKRVKVAEDCLLRIQNKQILPYSGATFRESSFDPDISLKDQLNDECGNGHCHACAKGGLFLAYIGRVNKSTMPFSSSTENPNNTLHVRISEIFSYRQLSLIEYAFEGTQYLTENRKGSYIAFSPEVRAKVKAFYNTYPYQSTKRMIAICENIIANKGTFKP